MNDSNTLVSTDLTRLRWVRYCIIRYDLFYMYDDESILRPRHEFSITPISEWHTPECVLESQNGQPIATQTRP